MADFGKLILELLCQRESLESLKLAEECLVDHQKIVGAIKSLQCLEGVSFVLSLSVMQYVLPVMKQDCVKNR